MDKFFEEHNLKIPIYKFKEIKLEVINFATTEKNPKIYKKHTIS